MATGLFVLQDGTIMVAFGARRIPISPAQYKANGYRPPFEKLKLEPNAANKARRQAEHGLQEPGRLHARRLKFERGPGR